VHTFTNNYAGFFFYLGDAIVANFFVRDTTVSSFLFGDLCNK
jgi:hypothetical protein